MGVGEPGDGTRPAAIASDSWPVRITWTRTEEEYLDALRLHQRRLPAQRLAFRVLLPTIFVLLLLYALLFGTGKIFVALASAYVVVAIAFFGLKWIALPRYGRRVFRQQKALHRPVTVELDETGLRASQGEENRASLRWDDAHGWLESSSYILVYPSEAVFYIFPMSRLLPSQVGLLRAILEARVSRLG